MFFRTRSLVFALFAALLTISSCLITTIETAHGVMMTGEQAGFSLDAVLPPNSRDGSEISSVSGSDSHWWINITIGTPPQPIVVVLDTGTVDLSVMSTFIDPVQIGLAPVYNPNKSTTAVLVDGYTWRQQYANSAPNMGYVMRDTVRVGSMYMTNFAFEVDNVTSIPHITSPPYGGLGLDPDPNGQPTRPKRLPGWLQTVMKFLYQPVFAIDFRRNSFKGVIDFGFIDSKKYNGNITYAPINQETLWAITIDGVGIGSAPYRHAPFNVTFDTGGDGLIFPRWAIDAYFAGIPNATWNAALNTYMFNCDQSTPYKLSDITFGVGDYRGIIPADHIHKGFAYDNVCLTSLRAGDVAIWGTSVIASQFVIFDYGNKRMGLAHKTI